MADKQDTDNAPSTDGGGKKLVLMVLGAVMLIGVSVGATLFFLGGSSPDAPQAEAPEEQAPLGDPRYVELGKAFTVNLEGGSGLLRISVALLVYTDALEEAIVQHMPRIRNALVLLFSGLSAADLQQRTGKDQLQDNALTAVKDILAEYSDTAGMELFFTDFVTQ